MREEKIKNEKNKKRKKIEKRSEVPLDSRKRGVPPKSNVTLL